MCRLPPLEWRLSLCRRGIGGRMAEDSCSLLLALLDAAKGLR